MSMEQVSAHRGHNQVNSPWQIPEFSARCAELWTAGDSAALIADKLNQEFRGIVPRLMTRNAILGHAHRVNFSTRTTANNPKDKDQAPRPRKKRLHVSRAIGVAPAWFEDQSIEPFDDQNIPLDQRKTIYQLTDKTCHWPIGEVGEPGFFFCGGASVEGSSYCMCHSRRAFRPYARGRTEHDYHRRNGRPLVFSVF